MNSFLLFLMSVRDCFQMEIALNNGYNTTTHFLFSTISTIRYIKLRLLVNFSPYCFSCPAVSYQLFPRSRDFNKRFLVFLKTLRPCRVNRNMQQRNLSTSTMEAKKYTIFKDDRGAPVHVQGFRTIKTETTLCNFSCPPLPLFSACDVIVFTLAENDVTASWPQRSNEIRRRLALRARTVTSSLVSSAEG